MARLRSPIDPLVLAFLAALFLRPRGQSHNRFETQSDLQGETEMDQSHDRGSHEAVASPNERETASGTGSDSAHSTNDDGAADNKLNATGSAGSDHDATSVQSAPLNLTVKNPGSAAIPSLNPTNGNITNATIKEKAAGSNASTGDPKAIKPVSKPLPGTPTTLLNVTNTSLPNTPSADNTSALTKNATNSTDLQNSTVDDGGGFIVTNTTGLTPLPIASNGE